MSGVRWVSVAGRVLSAAVLPVLVVATVGAAALVDAPVHNPWGTCTAEMRVLVGSPCWSPEPPRTDDAQALADAAALAEATEGMDCWDPAEGRLGSQVVVDRDGVVEVLPFTDETWEAAQAGEFWTLRMCA